MVAVTTKRPRGDRTAGRDRGRGTLARHRRDHLEQRPLCAARLDQWSILSRRRTGFPTPTRRSSFDDPPRPAQGSRAAPMCRSALRRTLTQTPARTRRPQAAPARSSRRRRGGSNRSASGTMLRDVYWWTTDSEWLASRSLGRRAGRAAAGDAATERGLERRGSAAGRGAGRGRAIRMRAALQERFVWVDPSARSTPDRSGEPLARGGQVRVMLVARPVERRAKARGGRS